MLCSLLIIFLHPAVSHFRVQCLRAQVFQGLGVSGSRFSESRLLRVQVFQDPGFSGSRFFRVRVQVLEVAKKKGKKYYEQKIKYWIFASLKRIKQLKWLNWTKLFLNKRKQSFAKFTEKHLCWSLFLIKSQASVLKKFQYSQKNTVLESLFNKVAGLKCNLTVLKRDSNTVAFL